MSTIMDTIIPDYAPGVAVVSGVPWIGPPVALYGAIGWSSHCVCSGGAAGTFASQVTNYGAELTPPGGVPWSPLYSDTIAANGSKFSAVSNAQAGEALGRFVRYVFTPSASGTLNIAMNIRRPSA